MLPHGVAELTALAGRCTVSPLPLVNGWNADVWDMADEDVQAAVDVYNAVHAADLTSSDPVVAKLAAQGIGALSLLAAQGAGLELVTRADVAEYAAAASVIASDDFAASSMLMPNIPKMARRKSDSGIDVFNVLLDQAHLDSTLIDGEQLGLASVKHTLTTGASDLRRNIQNSVSSKHELSQSYLMAQLRYVVGRLIAEGVPRARANRTFLFMDGFPDPDFVSLFGIAVVDPSLRADMITQLKNLPAVPAGHKFRIITFPDLANVHLRCP